jgi:hypothetical protein
MKRLPWLILIAALIWASPAAAQTCQMSWFNQGSVPSAAQWQSCWNSKQNTLTYTPLSTAGGTMLGKLNLVPSLAASAGINIGQGVTPVSPINGDIWVTIAGMYVQVNGTTVGPLGTPTGVYLPITGGTMTGDLVTAAPTTAGAGFNLPPGTAPTSPNNGDCWTTTAGLFCQVNGVTQGPYGSTGSGTVNSGTTGQVAYYAANGTTISGQALSALIDSAIGNAQGDILYRGASSWAVLAPGAGGNFLETQGASANPQWASAVAPLAITGFLPSAISGSSTTAVVTISNGQAADVTGTVYITGSTLPQWKVSNGNAINGYAGGTTLPNSATIHFYACTGSSGTGIYSSTAFPLASGAASCPTGYTSYYRHIFALVTSSSGTPYAGTGIEVNGGGMQFVLSGAVANPSNPYSVSGTAALISEPTPHGFSVTWIGRGGSGSTAQTICFTSPYETSSCGGVYSTSPGYDLNAGNGSTAIMDFNILTNTSGQIQVQSSGGTPTVYDYTRGWIESRRY